MNTLQLRGYIARTLLTTGSAIDAAGKRWVFSEEFKAGPDEIGFYGGGISARLRLRVTGGNPIRLFWTAADFAANTNYLELASGALLSEEIEAQGLWIKSVLGSDMELTILYRRG